MSKKILNNYISILLITLFSACASIMAPSGGPKDTSPPEVREISPPNKSLNFSEKNIYFLFDEYLALKNVNQEFFSSPPLAERPEIKSKGKEMILKLNSELKENTTYCFNFGKSVADLNEGNSIPNFKYIFSTGHDFDTMSIKGAVVEVFTNKKEEDILVLLYKNHEDSAPKRTIPDYITKTNKNGEFEFSNITQANYKIYALKDANNNMKFDMPNEKFAFTDTILFPIVKIIEKRDTIKLDSIISKTIEYSPNNIILNLFEADFKKQNITKQERKIQDKCILSFNKAFEIKPEIKLIENTGKIVYEYSNKSDSITCWIMESTLIKNDTLRFALNYKYKNEFDSLIEVFDSLRFIYSAPKKDKINIKDSLFLPKVSTANSGALHFNKKIILTFDKPFMKINKDSIKLYSVVDSTKQEIDFSISIDSLNYRKALISSDWLPNTNYLLILDSGAFENYFEIKSSKLESGFSTPKYEDFVNLSFIISNNKSNLIVQLINSKDVVLEELLTSDNSTLTFKHIKPQNYKLKIIFDTNNNKIWDTGNYYIKKHAEKVIFYNKEINLKPNFDQEIELNINKLNE